MPVSRKHPPSRKARRRHDADVRLWAAFIRRHGADRFHALVVDTLRHGPAYAALRASGGAA